MKKHIKNLRVTIVGALAIVGLTIGNASAQPGGGMGGPGGMPGMGGMAGMDPAAMQQQIQLMVVTACREKLVVTNDAEWSVISDRLGKVVKVRMDDATGSLGIMNLLGGAGRGGRGGGRGGFGGMMGTPSAEATALQHAIDANAPAAQIKTALEKQREARARKKADIVKAQDDLRQVISLRQEAILVSLGVLE